VWAFTSGIGFLVSQPSLEGGTSTDRRRIEERLPSATNVVPNDIQASFHQSAALF